jgi:hypothetical protein
MSLNWQLYGVVEFQNYPSLIWGFPLGHLSRRSLSELRVGKDGKTVSWMEMSLSLQRGTSHPVEEYSL